MSGTFDKAKGEVKETVGDATDDKGLEREGKADQVAGKAKDRFSSLVDSVKSRFGRNR